MALKLRAVEIDRITTKEFAQMPEFDGPYELIAGRIIEKEMPGDFHSRIADKLQKAIWRFDFDEKLGKAWREANVDIDAEDTTRAPDLCYIVASRVPPVSDGAITVMPDLVVEVWSPSDVAGEVNLNSTRTKMQIWPRNGVKITWCVNPAAKEVEVLYTDPLKPDIIQEVGDELDGEDVLPGFKLKVSDLFT